MRNYLLIIFKNNNVIYYRNSIKLLLFMCNGFELKTNNLLGMFYSQDEGNLHVNMFNTEIALIITSCFYGRIVFQ